MSPANTMDEKKRACHGKLFLRAEMMHRERSPGYQAPPFLIQAASWCGPRPSYSSKGWWIQGLVGR